MKKLRNIFMITLCCIVAAASFTSCMDSEDYSIDPTTYKQYMTEMAKQYGGMVRFYYLKSNNGTSVSAEKYDSIGSYWVAKEDSTVTLYRFPVSKLDSSIVVPSTDNTEKANMLRALRSQLKDAPETELKSWFYIPSKNAITSQYVQFYVNPSYIETEYTYKDEKKKAYFLFYSNAYTGIWSPTDRTFQYQMGLYAICLDKLELNSEHTVTTPYLREIYITCEAK